MKLERAKQTSESIEIGIILAIVGGFMDVYSYMGRGGVFANAQTGNILLTGVHLSEGNFGLALRFLVPVLCFAAGIMVSDLVHDRFSHAIHWRQVTVLVEALFLLVVAFLGPDLNLVANCMTSFACGMQVESFRKIHGRGVATTMCIGNLRNALQSVDDYLLTGKHAFLDSGALYFGAIGCFVAGAVVGNWCLARFGLNSIALCSLLLIAAFFLMFADRERTRRGRRARD